MMKWFRNCLKPPDSAVHEPIQSSWIMYQSTNPKECRCIFVTQFTQVMHPDGEIGLGVVALTSQLYCNVDVDEKLADSTT